LVAEIRHTFVAMDPYEYEPHYVDVDTVPIEVEDSGYSTHDKRYALFSAETALEADRNGGEKIPDEDVNSLHIDAVLNLATYHLVRPAKAPDNVKMGDLGHASESSDSVTNHAKQYKDTYEEIIDKLSEVGPDGDTGTYFGAHGGGSGPKAVNTGRNARRHSLGNINPENVTPPVDAEYVNNQ